MIVEIRIIFESAQCLVIKMENCKTEEGENDLKDVVIYRLVWIEYVEQLLTTDFTFRLIWNEHDGDRSGYDEQNRW